MKGSREGRSAAEGEYSRRVVLEPLRAGFGRRWEGGSCSADHATPAGRVGKDRPFGIDGQQFVAMPEQDGPVAICAYGGTAGGEPGEDQVSRIGTVRVDVLA